MTNGRPHRLMIRFALPMLAGNLFQQFYNIVDTLIVGRFVGREALAAVGSAFAIMVLFNSLLIGLSMGAAVLYSQLFGADDRDQLKVAIIMGAAFILAVSAALSIGTYLATDSIIAIYQMPPETVGYARDYLQCIFIGLIFISIYNFAASTLRALGDSRSPLYFLILACLINVVLDLLFVVQFNMEVFGAALATVIAQFVSAVACVIYMIKKISFLQFTRQDCRYHKELFGRLSRYALLTSMQQSVMNFGIVLVQGLVNTFGAVLMAAFAAGVKIDAFAYMPLQDFGNAFSTYTAQNMGAKRWDRVREGLRTAVMISIAFAAVVSVFVLLFAEHLIALFVGSEDIQVIAIGAQYLRIEGIFYFLIGLLFLLYGFYRGLGKAGMSIVLTIASLGTRVVLAYVFAPLLGYSAIFWAIPIGWLLADLIGFGVWRYLQQSMAELQKQ